MRFLKFWLIILVLFPANFAFADYEEEPAWKLYPPEGTVEGEYAKVFEQKFKLQIKALEDSFFDFPSPDLLYPREERLYECARTHEGACQEEGVLFCFPQYVSAMMAEEVMLGRNARKWLVLHDLERPLLLKHIEMLKVRNIELEANYDKALLGWDKAVKKRKSAFRWGFILGSVAVTALVLAVD